MNAPDVAEPPLDLVVRVGCALAYDTTAPTPVLLAFKPRLGLRQLILEEQLRFGDGVLTEQFIDAHDNVVYRMTLAPGRTEFRHDALFLVPGVHDNFGLADHFVPIERLPHGVVRYTLPSRYCDADKLMGFAWQTFGHLPDGIERVRAVCDWAHRNIEYRYGSGSPLISAADVVARGYGVCRDLAHVGVALCRALNIPARYVSGHVPDIGVVDPGIAMDFHAYMEVFLGGHWHAYDPRNNVPRIGRVKIAHGLDAVDTAFSTLYGAAALSRFEVWAYQVDPSEVRVGDPIDLSKRLDGTVELRRPRCPSIQTA